MKLTVEASLGKDKILFLRLFHIFLFIVADFDLYNENLSIALMNDKDEKINQGHSVNQLFNNYDNLFIFFVI